MLQLILTSSVLGIILAVITSLLWNIAPIPQKEALAEMPTIDAKQPWKHTMLLFRNRKWLSGFLLALVGGVTYMLATQMAGIIAVQPLMNVGLIVLAVMANRRLGEDIDTYAKIGIFLMILTPVFIALGGVTEPIMFTTYDGLLLYCGMMLVAIVAMLTVSNRMPILWAMITSFLQALGATFTQWFTLTLFAGDDIIQGLINGLLPLILLASFMFVTGVYAVSIGLQRNPASRFNSITGTFSMITVVIGGIMIFGQMVTSWPFYGFGLLTGIAGVILLSKFH